MIEERFAAFLGDYTLPTLEEKLQGLSDCAKIRRTRYTEVKPVIEEAIAELERLREIEFMYQSCFE